MVIQNLTYNDINLKFYYEESDNSGIGCIHEIVSRDEYKLYKWKNKNSIFVDIGGNHGLVTIILALQNPNSTIYILEPIPSLVNIIKENLKINNISNVIVINKALGNGEKVDILIGNSCSGASSTIVNNEENFMNKFRGIKDKITVETITFDNLLNQYNIKNIELLKIDCEGGEYFLYDSNELKKKIINNIVGEFHNLTYNIKLQDNWDYTSLTNYIKEYVSGEIILTYLDL